MLILAARPFEREALFQRFQNLANAEQPDHRDQEVESLEQRGESDVSRSVPVTLFQADRCEREPDHHRGDGLRGVSSAHPHERAEGEQVNREEFRRAELEGETRHHRRQERDHDHRDQRSHERRGEGCSEGGPALPFCASGWPSNVVATDQGSPGMLNSTEVMAPPNNAPQ